MFRSVILWILLGLATAIGLAWPNTSSAIAVGQTAPELSGAHWINSDPLTIEGLKGRVVLVEFWTYG